MNNNDMDNHALDNVKTYDVNDHSIRIDMFFANYKIMETFRVQF